MALINQGASYNVVGGTSPGEGNVISGNGFHGVEVSHPDFSDPSNPKYSTGNQVIGNFIGTDPTGEKGPEYTSNGSRGVHFEDDHAPSPPTRQWCLLHYLRPAHYWKTSPSGQDAGRALP